MASLPPGTLLQKYQYLSPPFPAINTVQSQIPSARVCVQLPLLIANVVHSGLV